MPDNFHASTDAWVDGLHREMIATSTGLDLVSLTEVEQHIVNGLLKAATTFPAADFSRLTPEQLAKTVSYMGKFLDEIHRLAEFARGHADSRPDLTTDWVKGLTEPQLRQVLRWAQDNAEHERAEVRDPRPATG